MNKKKKFKEVVSSNMDYRIITVLEPQSIAAEAYRRIKVALEYSDVENKIKVIQMCSAAQGEGKTITALNLAATYAEEEKKAIVIDLDFRRPKIHRSFKVENKNGIIDFITGNAKKEDIIQHSACGIDFIVRGHKTTAPTVLLGSEALKNFIEELRVEYDIIIVDCPPILAVTDAITISKFCDGCIFVVSQKNTERQAAKEAVSMLKRNGVALLGAVMVNISYKNTGYDYKYKYYYHYNDK